jgi:signal transduction histidine kinase
MPNPTIVHIRHGRSLDFATYVMLGILIVVGVIVFRDPTTLAAIVVLCLAFGLVFWVGSTAVTTQRRALIYFVAQTIILAGLVMFARTSDVFGLLFYLLGIQAVLLLPNRLAIAWIVVFYLLDSSAALWYRGAEGVVNVLFNAAVFALTFAFGDAIRRAELARRENEQLVADLRLAQRQVQELAAADERNRLARDLHDSVKQQVFATIMQLGTARTLVEHDPQAARAHIVEAEGLAQQTGAELTLLIHELRPAALGERGLAEALRNYAADWSRQSRVAAEVRTEAAPILAPATQHALLRITQEALANVARHSGASAVAIDLCVEDSTITLTIADDGRGFDPDLVVRGVGLASMRERAEALGGSLRVSGVAGGGASVVASVPAGDDKVTR